MIVNDHFYYRDIVAGSCCDLVHIHTEAAVTCNIDHRFILASHLCTDGSTKAITHSAQTAGSKKSSRLTVLIILCSPHLMLSHLCYDHSVPAGNFVYSLDNIWSCEYIFVITQRIHILHTLNMGDPLIMINWIQMGV